MNSLQVVNWSFPERREQKGLKYVLSQVSSMYAQKPVCKCTIQLWWLVGKEDLQVMMICESRPLLASSGPPIRETTQGQYSI